MAVKPGIIATAIASFALTVGGAFIAVSPGSVPVQAMAAVNVVHSSPAVAVTTAPAIQEPRHFVRPYIPAPPVTHKATVVPTHAAVIVTPTPTPTPTYTTVVPTTQAPQPTPTYSSPAPTKNPTTPPPSTGGDMGAALLNKALTMQGVPYVYGGDTPGGFDCSGLVYWAALQLGVSSMPRDTYEMLGQGVSEGLLIPTSYPSYGDLAFFGSGHVEFYVKAGETFGAQQPGTTVGYHSYGYGYVPTEFFKIK